MVKFDFDRKRNRFAYLGNIVEKNGLMIRWKVII